MYRKISPLRSALCLCVMLSIRLLMCYAAPASCIIFLGGSVSKVQLLARTTFCVPENKWQMTREIYGSD